MKNLIIAAAMALCSATAGAADVLVYGVSHHFGGHVITSKPSQDYNERNLGLGLEAGGFGVGVYRDSYRNLAKMAYVTHYFGDKDGVQIGIRAGWLDGSGYNGPVAIPTVRYRFIEGAILPAPTKERDGVAAIWLRFEL